MIRHENREWDKATNKPHNSALAFEKVEGGGQPAAEPKTGSMSPAFFTTAC
jgi:hypothetical protein